MRSVLGMLISVIAVSGAFAQCPGANQLDVNRASAQTLSAHGIPVTVADAIKKEPLRGYSDLAQLAADNHFQLAPELVVCPVTIERKLQSGPHLISAGDDEIASINVNSSSVDDLASLRTCGKSLAELTSLATTNQNKRFATPAEFLKWLGANQSCPDLTFRLWSKGETFTLPRATPDTGAR